MRSAPANRAAWPVKVTDPCTEEVPLAAAETRRKSQDRTAIPPPRSTPLQPEDRPGLPSQGSLSSSSGITTPPPGPGKFLDEWCRQTMRSRIEPMKKIARSLRQHRELILNYFRAKKVLSSGVVEGLNNKAKVTMRKSYGFRTFRILELAL